MKNNGRYGVLINWSNAFRLSVCDNNLSGKGAAILDDKLVGGLIVLEVVVEALAVVEMEEPQLVV